MLIPLYDCESPLNASDGSWYPWYHKLWINSKHYLFLFGWSSFISTVFLVAPLRHGCTACHYGLQPSAKWGTHNGFLCLAAQGFHANVVSQHYIRTQPSFKYLCYLFLSILPEFCYNSSLFAILGEIRTFIFIHFCSFVLLFCVMISKSVVVLLVLRKRVRG